MADPITGAVVSGLFKLICDKLGSPLFEEIGRAFGVKTELARLSRTLSSISAVLLDAEEKQITLHSVRDWLLNLKDVAHDIEDELDLISTEALEDKVHKRTFAPRIRGKFPHFTLAAELKALCDRLEEISANRRDFNLQERQLPPPSPVCISRERDCSSFIQQSNVFGREQDKDRIVSLLVSSSSQQVTEIPILPIVGIGGLGKTTLAKLVFNDPRVGDVFTLKLWASFPDKFTKKIVLEKIYQYAKTASEENASELSIEEIEKRSHDKIVTAKTFLLVLDNVWLEDSKEWVDLKEFLEVGSKSSRIIVTTRENRVASFAGSMEAYKLEPLSEDDCLSVFVKYAFRKDEEKKYPSLVQIGKKIVQKCCGVPLAARTLGSQLWSVRDEFYWRRIEESKFWEIEQAPDDILPALKLTFDQLPCSLRPCFSFCSALIRNGRFRREEIVNYWLALGLVQSTGLDGPIEDFGTSYFNELVSRSLFELCHAGAQTDVGKALLGQDFYPSLEGDHTNPFNQLFVFFRFLTGAGQPSDEFQMHDLMHELAASVAGEETAFVSCDTHDISIRAKHLVWTEEELSEREFPCQLLTANKARSFLLHNSKKGNVSKSFLHSLISKFRYLRILQLSNFEFEDLPNSIGDLKHLRYLSMAGNTKLKSLPDSVSGLVNLQTLDISGCEQLQLFPKKLHRLVSLRHLYFTSQVASFPEMGFHGWTFIQEISIVKCEKLRSLPEQIGTLTTLRVLWIEQCPCLSSLPNSIKDLIALEKLVIWACVTLNLSGWEGLKGLARLRSLYIKALRLLEIFPDGLQHTSGSLQYLIIDWCSNLIELPESLQHCTSLLMLKLYHCPKLAALPRGIKDLKNLRELWIVNCPILRSRCEKEIGDDWNLISHIPIIQVSDI